MAAEPAPSAREVRRLQRRTQIMDALIDEIMEHQSATFPRVARRASISTSTMTRYFSSLDDLISNAAPHYFVRYSELFAIPSIGEGSLTKRVGTYVSARVTLYETVQKLSRFVRTRLVEEKPISDGIQMARATLGDQTRQHFDDELGGPPTTQKADIADAAIALTSFEGWDYLHSTYGRDRDEITRVWESALLSLLGPVSPDTR